MKGLNVLLVALVVWLTGFSRSAEAANDYTRRCSRLVQSAIVTPEILVTVLTAQFPDIEDWKTMWELYSKEQNGDKLFEIAAIHLLLEVESLESLQAIKSEARVILMEAKTLESLYGKEHVVALLPLYLVLDALEQSRPKAGTSYPLSWLRARVIARFTSSWKPSALKAEPEEFDTGSETARSKLFGNDGIRKRNVRPLRAQDVRVVSPASE